MWPQVYGVHRRSQCCQSVCCQCHHSYYFFPQMWLNWITFHSHPFPKVLRRKERSAVKSPRMLQCLALEHEKCHTGAWFYFYPVTAVSQIAEVGPQGWESQFSKQGGCPRFGIPLSTSHLTPSGRGGRLDVDQFALQKLHDVRITSVVLVRIQKCS